MCVTIFLIFLPSIDILIISIQTHRIIYHSAKSRIYFSKYFLWIRAHTQRQFRNIFVVTVYYNRQCPQIGGLYGIKNKAAIALQCEWNCQTNSCPGLYYV